MSIIRLPTVSMDLSPAFQKGAKEHLPNAQVTFDRFHLMKLVNEAVEIGFMLKEIHVPPSMFTGVQYPEQCGCCHWLFVRSSG